jgi:hypothetical protein
MATADDAGGALCCRLLPDYLWLTYADHAWQCCSQWAGACHAQASQHIMRHAALLVPNTGPATCPVAQLVAGPMFGTSIAACMC